MSHGHPAHDDRALPPPRVEEVADNVFAYLQPDGTWWINNTGFVVGASMVLSIDTCATERRTREYLRAVSEHGGRPPRVLVNTHHHGDHTHGNSLLGEATVVGHRRCREEILGGPFLPAEGLFEPVEWGDIAPAPPFITFEERLDLFVGDLAVELHHVGTAAHTTNDVVAWLPERRVLFAGDLVFNGGTPFFVMGSLAGSLVALDYLVELGAEVVVPGHGPPCGPEVFDTVGAYLRFVQELAAEAHASGQGPLEAARQIDLGPFAELTDPERLAGNLHRAYAECAGARPGAPIDLVAAFTDMIALNGGRPLRCLA
jgi:cyclase